MKPYLEMTPEERLADRIAKNRAIEQRVASAPKPTKPAHVTVPRWFRPWMTDVAAAITKAQAEATGAITAKCWRRDYIVQGVHVAAIRTLLTKRIEAWVASGARKSCHSWARGTAAVSVQTAIQLVRDDLQINFPTQHAEAETVLRALGFELERLQDAHTTILVGWKE